MVEMGMFVTAATLICGCGDLLRLANHVCIRIWATVVLKHQ
jgi:hypothetical protein